MDNMNKQFDCVICTQWHKDMFIDTVGFWTRDWLLQVIHGVLLFVQIVLSNALTGLQISRMIREMYRDWKNCNTRSKW